MAPDSVPVSMALTCPTGAVAAPRSIRPWPYIALSEYTPSLFAVEKRRSTISLLPN